MIKYLFFLSVTFYALNSYSASIYTSNKNICTNNVLPDYKQINKQKYRSLNNEDSISYKNTNKKRCSNLPKKPSISNTIICSENKATLKPSGAIGNNASYQWYGTQTATNTLAITTTKNPVYVTEKLNNTNSIATIQSYWVSIKDSNSCESIRTKVDVTINPKVTPTFTQVSAICSKGTFSLPTTSTNTPSISGTWSPTINNTATTSYTFTPASGTCANTATMSVTVNPLPVVTVNSPSVCSGASATVTATHSPKDTYTYAWTVPATATAQSTASFSTSVAGEYKVKIKNTTTLCESTEAIGKVTLKPLPNDPKITMNEDVCSGSTGTFTIKGTAGDIVSYSGVTGTPWSPVTLPASGTLDVTVSNVTADITMTLTKVDNGSCSKEISLPSTIKVKVIPELTQPGNLSKCPLESVAPSSFVSTPTGATFAWTNTNSSVGLAASGTGDITAYTAPSNFTVNEIVSEVSVTPTLNGCPGKVKKFTITIKPTPVMAVPSNITKCKGDAVGESVFSTTPPESKYAWTNSNTTIGLKSDSGIGNIPSFIATNTTSSAITSTVEIEPTLNGCKGSKQQYTITVNPSPNFELIGKEQEICSGDTAKISINNSTGNFTYYKQEDTTNLFENSKLEFPLSIKEPSNYYVRAKSNEGCWSSKIDKINVKVISYPNVSIVNTSPYFCNGGSTKIELNNLDDKQYDLYWIFDSIIKDSINPLIVKSVGKYFVKVFPKGKKICYTERDVEVKMVENPPKFLINGPDTLCSYSKNRIYEIENTNNDSITWKIGNIEKYTRKVYINAANSNIEMNVKKTNKLTNCSSNQDKTIYIDNKNQAPNTSTIELLDNNLLYIPEKDLILNWGVENISNSSTLNTFISDKNYHFFENMDITKNYYFVDRGINKTSCYTRSYYKTSPIAKITDINLEKLSIYPNPVISSIQIKGLIKNLKYQYEIITAEGRNVKSGYIFNDDFINLEDLNNGIFLIKINNQSFKFTKL